MKSLVGAARVCSRTGPAGALAVSRRSRSTGSLDSSRPGTPKFSQDRNQSVRESLQDDSTAGGQGPTRSKPMSYKNYRLFKGLVLSRFELVLTNWGPWTLGHKEYRSCGLNSQNDVDREVRLFRKALDLALAKAGSDGITGRAENPLFWGLRNAFVRGDTAGLGPELKYAFQNFVLRSRFTKAVTAVHHRLADFRNPYEWFPATRMMQRTIHLHVGPTNSGKTYRALQALEKAKTGIYAGPLRLLAHEIYSRFKAKGRPCALVTGEEQRIPEGADTYFSSCTVEMTPLNQRVDVAVIDEIQMIADLDRGWAWTQAFLGVQAKEVHLCGEERAVDLIQAICARIGDKCVVHRYKRLSGLQPMGESLRGNFKRLQKGDAIVAFSRIGLHSLKAGIEKATGRRCAIVYGSLPPETRAQQAALFNDPKNDYDFLVASDAIGMGLNLEIRRIIFETVVKRDATKFRVLTVPEVKQIGGRAGRYRTAAQDILAASSSGRKPPTSSAASTAVKSTNVGLVTTLDEDDLHVVHDSFETEAEPLKTAGLFPPSFVIEQFSSYFPPNTPLSFILQRIRETAKLSDRFHLCDFAERLEVADVIQPLPMPIYDRCVLLAAPVTLRDPGMMDCLKAMAQCISDMRGGHLLDIKEIDLEILEVELRDFHTDPAPYLRRLESLHKAITLYLWLTYRYVGVFTSQHLAFHVKSLVEDKITDYLEHLNYLPRRRKQRTVKIKKIMERTRLSEEMLLGPDAAELEAENQHEGPGQWEEEGHEEPLMEDDAEIEVTTPGPDVVLREDVARVSRV